MSADLGTAQSEARPGDVIADWRSRQDGDPAPLIVLEGLAAYLPGDGPIEARSLGSGHSNETFEIRRDGRAFVLRRPPRPPFPPSAHDVIREARILDALSGLFGRAPRPIAFCADPEPIGAPFYLMEKIPGVVIRERMPAGMDDPDGRRAAVEAFVDALAEIHAIPWRGTPLAEIGRPDGYLERQLRRWESQWEHNRTRSISAIDEVGAWLRDRFRPAGETSLVHGDAKLDNAIFATEPPPRIAAIVDWEMATLGDPLADLGLLCATYVEPGEEPDPVLGFSAATAAPGAPTRAEVAERYAERSGRDVSRLLWYEVLALWKLAILLEGSYKRFLSGATGDQFFARLEAGIPRIAGETAARIATEGEAL